MATTLQPEKVTRRVRARWRPDGPAFDGYEIHMGVTTVDGAPLPLLEVDGRAEGCVSPDGRVWGTYVHGLFESGAGRRLVLDWARGADGPAAPPSAPLEHRALREAAYERLADILVDSIDPRLLRELAPA